MNAPINGNSQDRAYEFIRSRILLLEYPAHSRLKALDIAEELKLSRTPVREALGRLEQEGLVNRDDGWGYVVRGVSIKDASDVYKVREALEIEAAREAIDRLNDGTVQELDQILTRSETALAQGKIPQFRANNKSFHARIAHVTGNKCLQQMLRTIQDRVFLLGGMVLDKRVERTAIIVKENREILEALAARDGRAAEKAVRAHVRGSWEAFRQYVMHEQL
jgi:DNA-binding GntR family transcriptional regulator